VRGGFLPGKERIRFESPPIQLQFSAMPQRWLLDFFFAMIAQGLGRRRDTICRR
jgi:hypothetical protein